ncbi:hypothetical protein GSI_00614 [Ganoderma sinense ZZ0214-1]|uniref:Uncharacterized protein n=1 Tax=Ganoderma sinense ZZ0214-1 TaxID=1077348 RepID=A0A2G8ST43_9APHY|nr:hypothetical protein GSI_00614 [Ganoderma sinense ZZ0214-1]
MTDLWGLQTELASLMAGVRRVEDSLRQAATAADDRTRMLQSKVEELEAANLARLLEIRQLELEKAELQREVQAKKPDLAAAIVARDDALKKLERARKVIEDLLRDHEKPRTGSNTKSTRRDDPRPSGNQPFTVSAPVTRQHPKRETIPAESDEESTVRPLRSGASTQVGLRPQQFKKSESAGIKFPTSPSSREVAGDSSARPATPSRARTPSLPKKRLQWYLEFANRISTAEVLHGPIPFDVISEQLVLDDDAVIDIGNLEFQNGYDLRIHGTDGGLVFVYRPVILDGTSGTYLIGWGEMSMVNNVKSWVGDGKEMHMFCFPAKENSGWFYLGLHKFSYAAIESVWHKLGKEDKEPLYAELRDRNPDMSVGEFKKDVKMGKLVQCCIRLESDGKKVESHDFLRQYGLLDADG